MLALTVSEIYKILISVLQKVGRGHGIRPPRRRLFALLAFVCPGVVCLPHAVASFVQSSIVRPPRRRSSAPSFFHPAAISLLPPVKLSDTHPGEALAMWLNKYNWFKWVMSSDKKKTLLWNRTCWVSIAVPF